MLNYRDNNRPINRPPSLSEYAMTKKGADTMRFYRASPLEFHNATKRSMYKTFLTKYTVKELNSFRLFLSACGMVGFGLTHGNELVNLFNTSAKKGAGSKAMDYAISLGACKLNCFDGFLVKYYEKFGFTWIAKTRFNPDFAPANWDYERYGKPYVVTMVKKAKCSSIKGRK